MVNPQDFGTFNLGNIVAQSEQIRASQARRQQVEQEAQQKRRLGELLPQIMTPGGGIGGGLPGNQPPQADLMRELAGIDPDLFLKLDERSKAQAKAELGDLTAAVRWADTPEKWAQVQQHFAQKGIDLSGYSVEQREQGMLALGKIGEYLESAPKMDIRATEPGGGLYGVDPRSGGVRVLVQPNDGGAPMGAPAARSAPPPPPPGFQLDGGPTARPSGAFPPSGS